MTTQTLPGDAIAAVAFTSLDTLADGGWAKSAAFASSDALEIHVSGKIDTGTVPAGGGHIYIRVSGEINDSGDYGGGLDATDEVVTWGTTDASHVGGAFDQPLIHTITVDATDDDTVIEWGPVPIGAYFGGALPANILILANNESGAALGADVNNILNIRRFNGDSV